MIALIIKDWTVCKTMLLRSLIWVAAGVLLTKSPFAALVIPIQYLIDSFVADDRSNAERLLLSLPVRRAHIVLSKYLFVLGVSFVGIVLAIACKILFAWLLPESIFSVPHLFQWNDLFIPLLALLLMMTIFIPAFLLYGFAKGFMTANGIFLGVCLLLLLASYFVIIGDGRPLPQELQGDKRILAFVVFIFKELKNPELLKLFKLATIGFSLILTFASMLFTLRRYPLRDASDDKRARLTL